MTDFSAGTTLGIVPVIPTPFAANQDIDLDALDRLLEFAVQAKAASVCLPAYGSEFYKLSHDERRSLVGRAVRSLDGRLPLMAQSNHPSARHAAAIARENQDLGAAIISFALPRQFALPEESLLYYAAEVANAVTVPVLVQDFNPGGPSVGAKFAMRLREAAPNFRYLKLEESGMGPKVDDITQATGGRVGVLEGWGGMYMVELMSSGIAGVMPGLPMCDLFVKVWELA